MSEQLSIEDRIARLESQVALLKNSAETEDKKHREAIRLILQQKEFNRTLFEILASKLDSPIKEKFKSILYRSQVNDDQIAALFEAGEEKSDEPPPSSPGDAPPD